MALINIKSKINKMNSIYKAKSCFHVENTEIKALKNNGFSLKIYNIVIAIIQVLDKLDSLQFF